MGKLNEKQRLFVAEYLKDKNATRAAKAAGYSKKTAQEQGSQLLSKLIVREAVEAGLQKQLKRAELTGDMVIARLRSHAFAELKDAYDKDGNLLHPHDMPKNVRAALTSIESYFERDREGEEIGVTKKIRLSDSIRALELLGKHFKLFTDVTASTVTATVTTVDEAAVKATREKIKGDC